MFLTTKIRTVDGKSLGVLVLEPKTFRSAKAGYHGQGKLTLDGQRCQAQCQLVAIRGNDPNAQPQPQRARSGDGAKV